VDTVNDPSAVTSSADTDGVGWNCDDADISAPSFTWLPSEQSARRLRRQGLEQRSSRENVPPTESRRLWVKRVALDQRQRMRDPRRRTRARHTHPCLRRIRIKKGLIGQTWQSI
jgi:hypothetical protein